MKTSVAAAGAAVVLVALSIIAIPAVASGADLLADASASTRPEVAPRWMASEMPASASRDEELGPLITAWGASGAVLLVGGAAAVAASVHRQRKIPA